MKKLYIFASICLLLPGIAAAQVEKQVEVTKAYVPSVEAAAKLPVVPDMVDTVKLRPEIDYTITPLSFATGLETRPIKPATVTYWQFNRPKSLYIKAGAGYPLNSVFDFYASSQNAGTGYGLFAVNHEGRFADIANEWGWKSNSVRMNNRIVAAGGKYFGPRTLEGELSYENRLYHQYGSTQSMPKIVLDNLYRPSTGVTESPLGVDLSKPLVGSMSDYSNAALKIRFGDDFTDLSRVNFDIALHGNFFFDHSEAFEYAGARQVDLGARVKLARAFGRHTIRFGAGYSHSAGAKVLADYKESLLDVGLRYGYRGGVVAFEAGADYYRHTGDSLDAENYIVPFAQLNINLGTKAIGIFAEADGRVRDNSYRTLTGLNPYVAKPSEFKALKSTAEYNFRFGIDGSIARERLTYRVYAGYTRTDNQLYWFNDLLLSTNDLFYGYFNLLQAQQDRFSVNVEGEWRPVSTLRLSLGLHGSHYNDEPAIMVGTSRERLDNGRPAFEGDFGVRYDLRKVSFGLSLRMQSRRSWSTWVADYNNSGPFNSYRSYLDSFEAPFAADLGLSVEWRINSTLTLFAEGRNLANQRLYEYAWYPEYGANCTLGIKANF